MSSSNPSGCDWTAVNYTELQQLCTGAGLPVHPRMSFEDMVALLEGHLQPIEENAPIDVWRDAIMAFVIDFWSKLHSQLTCPAKTKDPRACYGCIDQQVIACLVKQKQAEPLIAVRRKNV